MKYIIEAVGNVKFVRRPLTAQLGAFDNLMKQGEGQEAALYRTVVVAFLQPQAL
ncbi:hypothetical protein D3C77_435290 [compost metagenome]